MKSPLSQFRTLWHQALRKKEPTADYLLLATADARHKPHVRTVLIKSIDAHGISFVTNAKGSKVGHFKNSPIVECCVVWPSLKLQIRIGGKVSRMPRAQVNQLWKKRLREAQILYHLDIKQSQPIPSYAYLKKKVAALAKKWSHKKIIPTSPNYVGYIIRPTMIEFLHHSPSRLNLREHFQKTPKGWTKHILAP